MPQRLIVAPPATYAIRAPDGTQTTAEVPARVAGSLSPAEPTVGDTITLSGDNASDLADFRAADVERRWERDGVEIAGETGTSYTTDAGDEDAVIRAGWRGPNDAAWSYTAGVTVGAASALPFVDDFSTDTSANWTKFGGDAELVISGGVATTDGVGGGLARVHRDVGLGPNRRVRMIVGDTTNGIILIAAYTDPDNWIGYIWTGDTPGNDERHVIQEVVDGTANWVAFTDRLRTLNPGDMIELELGGDGTLAYLRRSTTGDPADLALLTAASGTFDGASVPEQGPGIGFGVRPAGTITEIWADNAT